MRLPPSIAVAALLLSATCLRAQHCPATLLTTSTVYELHGSDGSQGMQGTQGASGTSGYAGNTSGAHKTPGGSGGRGHDGGRGQFGHDGGPGPDVLATVALSPDQHCIEVQFPASNLKSKSFWLDTRHATLRIRSEGGRGGSGGRGGAGGQGGHGGSGSPKGSDGSKGMNGSDGLRGHDGTSGKITLRYAPEVKPFLTHLDLPEDTALEEADIAFVGVP